MNGVVPQISVVICSLNGATKIGTCLAAIQRQTLGRDVEVVVVDDGSADETAKVVQRLGFRVLRHATNRGLSAARNTGIRATSAPIIAFTDDDCIPADDWLERVVAEYDDPRILAVGGTVAPFTTDNALLRYLEANNPLAPVEIERTVSSSVLYRAYLYMRRNAVAPVASGRRDVYSLVGANFSVRREHLDLIGLFDERITFGGDEEDVCRRLLLAIPNGRLVYSPAAIVAHDYNPHVRDTLRRSYAYGKGSARAFLKNSHQFPTVFPLPAAVLACSVLGLWHRAAFKVAAALPLLAFPRWPVEALRRRSIEPIGYAYIQMLQETASDVGFAHSFARLRREYMGARGDTQ